MEAPRIPKIFFRNLRSEPRKFNFKPRYYDQKKEEWEKRKKDIEKEVSREKSGDSERVSWSQSRGREYYRSGVFSANLRLILILGILCFVVWAVIKKLELIAN